MVEVVELLVQLVELHSLLAYRQSLHLVAVEEEEMPQDLKMVIMADQVAEETLSRLLQDLVEVHLVQIPIMVGQELVPHLIMEQVAEEERLLQAQMEQVQLVEMAEMDKMALHRPTHIPADVTTPNEATVAMAGTAVREVVPLVVEFIKPAAL
jgi:hypothetical protein